MDRALEFRFREDERLGSPLGMAKGSRVRGLVAEGSWKFRQANDHGQWEAKVDVVLPQVLLRQGWIRKSLQIKLEAGAGIEPAVELLQSSALPLGDPAAN